MLQRVQTIYLLIVVFLMAAILFLPLAVMQAGDLFYTLDITGLSNDEQEVALIYPIWALFVLTVAMLVLPLITIFLYKKRMLQIRLCVFNAILMIGFYALFAFFAINLKNDLQAAISIKIALAFPMVSLILNYLAIRAIGADEMLVRSLDRLR